MITLFNSFSPIRGVFSAHDARRKVDQHYVTYLCSPDVLNPTPHEWVVLFETRRRARFEPPSEFPDKAAAAEYARSLR